MILRLHKHIRAHVKKYHKHYLGGLGVLGLFLMVTSLIASITNIFAATGGPNYPSTAANVTGTGTIAWTNPTRLTGNDTLYATAVLTTSTYSNYIQATGYGLSIPTGATINGIVVSIMRMSSANGGGNSVADVNLNLLKNGSIIGTNRAATGTARPISMTAASYGSTSDLRGTTWTPADINASNFGVSLSVRNQSSASSRTASVNYITITVTYTPDTTPPTVSTGYISSGSTGTNGGNLYYVGTINVRADVSDTGGLSGATCMYTTGSTRAAATYNTTYCEATSLNPNATINIRFRISDLAGNTTTGATGTYLYDNTAPSGGSFTINNNATYTTSTSVTLNTTCPTDAGVSGVQVAFGNSAAPTNRQSCTASMAQTLTAGDATKTVYMRFKDSLGNSGSDITDTIILDTAGPTVLFTDDVLAGPVTSDTIAGNRGDATIAKWMYTGGTSCPTTSGTYTYTSGTSMNQTTEANNGKYICLYGEDAAGNKSTIASANPINIDITPPTFAGVTSGQTYTNTTGVTITFSDNKPGVTATLNGSGYASGTQITGNNTYVFIATDAAGNSTGATFTIAIDTTPPTVSTGYISSGTTGSNGGNLYYVGTINVRADVSDDVGLSGATCMYTTGSTRAAATYNTTYCEVVGLNPAATINIRFRISDTSNHTTTGATGAYIYDGTAPSGGSFTINNDATYTTSTSVTLNTTCPTDAGVSGVQVAFGNSAAPTNRQSCTASMAQTLTAGDATKTVYMRFKDALGNTTSDTNDTIILDTTAPTFAGVTSGTTYYNATGVTITFSDDHLSGATLSGNAYTSGTQITGNGTYVFVVTDLAGNSTGATFTINIDSIPPTLSVIHITSTNALSGALAKPGDIVTVSFTGSEALTGVYITIDGNIGTISGTGINRLGTWTMNISDTGGIIPFTIDFYDLAYNTGAQRTGTTDASVVSFDNIAPTANVVYDINSLTNHDVIATLTGYLEPITVTSVGGYTHTFTGNDSFTFEFHDAAGNTGSTGATVTWIDKSPVTGTIAYDITGLTNTDVIASITFNKTGVSGVTGYTFTGNGTYEFTFTDAYGNTGAETAHVTWIDKLAPFATVDYVPTSGSVTSGSVTATITGFSEDITGLNAGFHVFTGNGTFTFTFYDLAYNPGSGLATVTWIDTTAPTLAPVTLVPTPTNNTTPQYTFSSNEAGTISYSGDCTSASGSAISGNNTIMFNTLSTGTHSNCLISVMDAALNPSNRLSVTAFTIDTAAPTAWVEYTPGSGSLTSGNVMAIVTGFDKPITGLNATGHLFASNGSYPFTFQDLAGNTGSVTANVTWIDTTAPDLTLIGANPQTIEVGNTYSELGATAYDTGDGGYITASIVIDDSAVNTSHTGSYTVTYNISDSAGNAAATGTRIVNVVDTTPPVLTLIGANPQNIISGDAYVELGAIAYDTGDGGYITSHIVINTGAVNTSVTGSYIVTYNISDSSGNPAATGTRTVNVVDANSPVIALLGSTPVTIEVGSTYSDAGATASDIEDGDLTPNIVTTGTVDIYTVGTYTIKYDVTDSSGNAAIQVIRTIHVVDTTAPDLTLIGADPQTIVSGHAYVELGATAYDTGDGGYISASIVIDASAVNTSVTGTYYVTYNISDSHSNAAATGTRTVNVIDATNPNHTYYHNNSPYYYPTTGTETTTTGEAETTTGHEAAGTGETETTTGTQGSVSGSTYSDELNNAYLYAYKIGIISMPTIQQVDMEGKLIRSDMARIMVNYAINVLDKTANTGTICDFNDIADESSGTQTYIISACQLGLMGIDMMKHFRPNDLVTRGQFGTILSRALWGNIYDGGTPYYLNHLQALKDAGIISNINPNLQELVQYVMMMIYRAANK